MPIHCAKATSFWSAPNENHSRRRRVILGAATVDESAITGESAPVIREAGGDRSAVTGGNAACSRDEIKIRITATRRRFSGSP